MKSLLLFSAFLLCAFPSPAQQPTSLRHGTVFGTKPTAVAVLDATKVEAFMGRKTRISTTIKGKVTKVTKAKGGWFEIDAGNGKTIEAHFKNYDVTIPMDLKGHNIIAEGVAEKQFIADDHQHLAGQGTQHGGSTNPNRKLILEVTGLMVE